MRPLFHPAVSDITVEGLLYALSDPVRAQIYAEMATSECPLNCSNFRKVANRTLPKATLSQHFKILREAGLIRSERKGVIFLLSELGWSLAPILDAIIDWSYGNLGKVFAARAAYEKKRVREKTASAKST